jgi:hypothetical protein
MGEKYPVRIQYGASTPWADHVQAQACIDGNWKWLEVEHGLIYVGKQEKFNPTTVLTVTDFIALGWYRQQVENGEVYKPLGIKHGFTVK